MSIQAQVWAKKQNVGNAGAKFVLWVLSDYADASGASCFPTIETICADTEQGERTISRHLDNLETSGFISRWRERRPDGTLGRYHYRLKLDRIQPPAILASGPPANLSPTTCQIGSSLTSTTLTTNTHTLTRYGAVDVLENVKGYALQLGFTEPEILPELESIDTLWLAEGKQAPTTPEETAAQVRRLLRHQANRLRKRVKPIASEEVSEKADTQPENIKLAFTDQVSAQDAKIWTQLCGLLPKPAVLNWLSKCLFDGYDRSGSGCLELYAPTAFAADHITSHMTIEIEKLWQSITGDTVRLRVAKLSKTNERIKEHA